jgi:hypothetical protein
MAPGLRQWLIPLEGEMDHASGPLHFLQGGEGAPQYLPLANNVSGLAQGSAERMLQGSQPGHANCSRQVGYVGDAQGREPGVFDS